ncbi:hypothetical protein SAPIO_CDS5690 [Scedosporium apiospermum]|uniref:Uncharacterized protein n=1 Tax=Pseudallescheria apiosperma TaxID=563466 RepID=A0A084G569_PSEDA|nr:uncharacterized protein SAPIO_CDS5690 [Scedosporium apiospermum]KEZ42481.1 hypothetical protein SAPIO_CDS5690 [Scedosporium apiospermum]
MSSLGDPETGRSVISSISGTPSSHENMGFGTAGTATLDADPAQLLTDPSHRAGAIDVEISTPHGTNNWLTHENGNPDLNLFLELDGHQISHDSGLGMGSGLAQLFTDVQSTEPVTIPPLLGGFCHLSTGEEPAVGQTLNQVGIPHAPVDRALAECIAAFQKSCLPYFPMLHSEAIRQGSLPLELKYSMAALGAKYTGEYPRLAKVYYLSAVECLQKTTTLSQLRILQTRVLLIEYAAWQTSKQSRQWAIREQAVAKSAILNLMSQPGQDQAYRRIDKAIREEILR